MTHPWRPLYRLPPQCTLFFPDWYHSPPFLPCARHPEGLSSEVRCCRVCYISLLPFRLPPLLCCRACGCSSFTQTSVFLLVMNALPSRTVTVTLGAATADLTVKHAVDSADGASRELVDWPYTMRNRGEPEYGALPACSKTDVPTYQSTLVHHVWVRVIRCISSRKLYWGIVGCRRALKQASKLTRVFFCVILGQGSRLYQR